ncbi:hypothetical protein [Puia sp.]|jgi:hypothetical protein|uniref:hypothetical protein n=1 Tax=Puia sp. TaxID=2045100 RepID=UPI002F3F1BD1
MEGTPKDKLIVKLQYRDYEAGEFTAIHPCDAAETIRLIANYPWEEQRDHISIGLTNPSITIEGPDNDFLKLSPYYNGKFVLHYFDKDHHLFTRSFDTISTVDPVIQSFFGVHPFDPAGFKKETTWLQSNSIHFKTQEFHYALTPARLIGPVLAALFLLVVATVWTLGFLALTHFSIAFLILPAAMIILLVRIAALAANHYRSAKDKLLILSKGKDEFSFGNPFSLNTYNKKDIRQITTYGRRQRGGYPALTRVEIFFENGRTIDISCLIIHQETLVAKFPHTPHSIVGKSFPFINPDAAALFG